MWTKEPRNACQIGPVTNRDILVVSAPPGQRFIVWENLHVIIPGCWPDLQLSECEKTTKRGLLCWAQSGLNLSEAETQTREEKHICFCPEPCAGSQRGAIIWAAWGARRVEGDGWADTKCHWLGLSSSSLICHLMASQASTQPWTIHPCTSNRGEKSKHPAAVTTFSCFLYKGMHWIHYKSTNYSPMPGKRLIFLFFFSWAFL